MSQLEKLWLVVLAILALTGGWLTYLEVSLIKTIQHLNTAVQVLNLHEHRLDDLEGEEESDGNDAADRQPG